MRPCFHCDDQSDCRHQSVRMNRVTVTQSCKKSEMNFILSKFMWQNGTRINQYLFATIITIPLLSFGMVQGWLSPMISVLQSPEGPSPEPFTSTDISWVTSVTYITAIIFGAPMGYLTDRYGRKIMTLITTLSLIAYWQIKLLSLEPWAVILARGIAGIPCSACYIVLPIYLKEISDIDLRGALGSLLILNRNIGYLASYIGADLLEPTTLLWIGLLVPTVMFFIFLLMPETPEFLVKQGKVDEAKTVLAWLRGVSTLDRKVEEEVEGIVKAEKRTQSDTKSVWGIILKDKPTFKAFIITLVIKITQQFDGYLIVLIYAGFVFERAADYISLKLSPNKQIIMIGVVQLLGSIVATCIVEKTGRKLLLITTSLAMGVGMLTLSAWFYVTAEGIWLPGWLPVLAMCVCIFADAAGFQPISYIIITDLFTFQLRGTVSSFANICAKLSNFVQMKWFKNLSELIGIHWTLLFFAIVCFAASFYTVIFFPETRNKTVDEIYAKLSRRKKKDNEEDVSKSGP
ncbi:PREDICTED: facilitated trehalose transporter Tret1-like [Papilio xuthus]|uniref:Facilitated trehalose transporter Tret1-like n=1 Tax=Papilio xuthus TaxID=66420 RepID=A0AAJ7E3S3_PAPXU|nr:PREDICTED: facilitated trehalose transporter Tret1-like [Papilio xuthus]